MPRSRRRPYSVVSVALLLIALGTWIVIVAVVGDSNGGSWDAGSTVDPEAGPQGANVLAEEKGHPMRTEIPRPATEVVAARSATGSLRIELTHADDAPGKDIVVSIAPAGLGRSAPSHRRTAHRSDAAGIVVKRDLIPGDYLVNVAYPLRIGERVRVEAGQEARLEVQFTKGCTIRGQVIDREGRPVAGARVWSVLEGLMSSYRLPIAVSDELGRFTLRNGMGFGSIGATKDRYAPSARKSVRGQPGDVLEVQLVLQGPGGGVRGTVVDAGGAPLAGATVWFPNRDLPWRFRGDLKIAGATPVQVSTNAGGRFEVDGLPPLVIAVMAGADGHGTVLTTVEVTAGVTTEVLLRLGRTCAVHGHFRSAAGTAVVGARIHASSHTAGNMADTVTDANGFYRLSGLTPGQVDLQVISAGKSRHEELALQEGEDRKHDIREAASQAWHCRVVDHEDRPVVGWRVIAMSAQRDMASAETDAAGRFTLEKINAEHSYRLCFFRDPNPRMPPAHTIFGARAALGEAVFRLPATAASSGSIRGRILDWQGRPLAKARVRCTHLDSGFPGTTKQEPGGGFVVTDLPAGEYQILVVIGKEPRFLPKHQLEPGASLDLGEIRGSQPATLTIAFTGSTDLRPTTVSLLDTHRNKIAEFPLDGGKLESYPTAAGTYFVQFHAEGLSSRTHRIRIAGGEHNHVPIRLQAATAQSINISFARPNTFLAQTLELRVIDTAGDLHLAEVIPFDMASGTTVVRNFPPGRYRVTASCRLGGATAEAKFEVTTMSVPTPVVTLSLR